MTAIINVVSSEGCPACKACGELLDRVKLEHPDVLILYHDANNKHVKRFQRLNLNKPVSSIKNAAVREHYERAGLKFLNGLPTIYITSSRRPNRILDIMVGCISPTSDLETRKNMKRDISNFFYKAKAYDVQFNTALSGRQKRRSGY